MTAADPNEWVSFVDQRFFYDDSDPPWTNRGTLKRLELLLRLWGLPTNVTTLRWCRCGAAPL